MLGGGIAMVKGGCSVVAAVEEGEGEGGGEKKPLLSHQLYIAFSDLCRVGVRVCECVWVCVCVSVCVCVKWYKWKCSVCMQWWCMYREWELAYDLALHAVHVGHMTWL